MRYSLGGQHPQNIDKENWIAPSADLIGSVILSANVSIWWQAVLRADNEPITIGARSNICRYQIRVWLRAERLGWPRAYLHGRGGHARFIPDLGWRRLSRGQDC